MIHIYLKVFLFSILLFIKQSVNAQTTVTVGGASSDYATLKLAFNAVNSGSLTGNIVIQIAASTTETASCILNNSGAGSANYNSILIYPTDTVTLTANINTDLISLNGADNVTIDGRINQSGSFIALTIDNLSYNANSSALAFINSACNNVLKYCSFKCSCNSSSRGVISFASPSSTTGNSNNLITQCDIGKSVYTPFIGICSYGNAISYNVNNVIINNNIYDFWGPSGSFGIKLLWNNSNWIISDNNFYQTAPRTASSFFGAILISKVASESNSSGTNYQITGNNIGGSMANCLGSPWIATTGTLNCISINAGNGGVNVIQNNNIKNFSLSCDVNAISTAPYSKINIIDCIPSLHQ